MAALTEKVEEQRAKFGARQALGSHEEPSEMVWTGSAFWIGIHHGGSISGSMSGSNFSAARI